MLGGRGGGANLQWMFPNILQTDFLLAALYVFVALSRWLCTRNIRIQGSHAAYLHYRDQCYSFQLPLDLKQRLICVHNKAKQFLSAVNKRDKFLRAHLGGYSHWRLHMSFFEIVDTLLALCWQQSLSARKWNQMSQMEVMYCLNAESKVERRRPQNTGWMLKSRWVSSRLTGPADRGFPGEAFLSPIIHHALCLSNTQVCIKRDTISPFPPSFTPLSLPPPSKRRVHKQRVVTPSCGLDPVKYNSCRK